MTDPVPTNRPVSGPEKATGPQPASKRGADEANGPEFQALLDKIEESAKSLAEQSRAVEKPEELAGAVDSARESLEDMLSLKDQLLEAYEQAKRQEPPKAEDRP